ncbi:MAG: division/cell wall cluster transcriptional repressor MraZ [Acidobacteria bacterium]|nr:division/cell wall cluster transcriptional repressor MraZ [Acidobacteriota bacterium]
MLRGNLPAKIDDKGRIKIPADFRKFVEEKYGAELYVTSLTGNNVLVYPLSEWEEIEAKLLAPPKMKPEKVKFLRNANYYGQVTQMDKQGRVLIQPHLRERAGMNGEVAIMGNLNYLEVWNNERFAKLLQTDPYTDKDAEILSEFGI